MGRGFAGHGGVRGPASPAFNGNRGQGFGGFHGSNGFRGSHGFHGSRRSLVVIQNGRFHRGFRSYGLYYPYSYGWYGGPLWDWESSSYDSRDSSYEAERYQTYSELNRLANEVQQLKEEREQLQAPPPAPAPPPQPSATTNARQDLPVVVVFLDKRIREVKNYAVANEMLVVLDDNKRTKFPLADIDLAATMKLNDERGVEFAIPNPVMTQ
jgi:hypothetical protein